MKDPLRLPKISIIMPCYNCVDYIERSIRSVISQNYPTLELIIKDAKSEDGTLEIINDYLAKYPNIIKVISGKDKGQTAAINIGMRKATGEVLAYLNADDVYKPGALIKVGEFFANNPDKMWVYGKCDIINADDDEIRKWVTSYKNLWLEHYSYTTLLVLNYISQMTCFWRKEAALKVGELDETQHYVMDYDYWLRLGKLFPAGVIKSYLASFRIVNTTKSSTGFIQQFADEYQIAQKYTGNNLILIIHLIHSKMIVFIYSILKFLSTFQINTYNLGH